MSSYLDLLPSNERQKIRTRLRSPEAYERLRERVKGPEDLEKELGRQEMLAEAHFALESEPRKKEALKRRIEQDLAEQGMEGVLEEPKIPSELQEALRRGRFDIVIDAHPATASDALMLLPDGAVQEKLPVKSVLSERYVRLLGGEG